MNLVAATIGTAQTTLEARLSVGATIDGRANRWRHRRLRRLGKSGLTATRLFRAIVHEFGCCCVILKLQFMQGVVDALLVKEFLMSPVFADFSMVKHKHTVTVLDRL